MKALSMAESTLSKKRYVPLSEAAKISGYTYEYIHRLCRIGKIPCLQMGEKMIVELDALLSETGTILLGGEHLGFIEIDEHSPYQPMSTAESFTPLVTPMAERNAPRSGHIAVVGETLRVNDRDKAGETNPPPRLEEKFPANALPFFSTMGKAGMRTGIHVAVTKEGVAPTPSSQTERNPIHIAVSTTNAGVVPKELTRSSSIKAVSVMPQALPSNFVPTLPMNTSAKPMPEVLSSSSLSTMSHDHDIAQYTSKLPVLVNPTSLMGRALLAVFAFGLLVLPTTLGVGNFLDETIKDFGGSLKSGARTSMAAVGIINPRKDVALFPFLEETSRLLSAPAAASPNTQNGIVVTLATGNEVTDQQVKDIIQKTFSSPVSVVPDAKDAKTGIIKPVFQKSGSANYIYVMVPFRN